jgi:Pectate lyase superfamily protein
MPKAFAYPQSDVEASLPSSVVTSGRSKVFNVVSDFGADNTGTTDTTAKEQEAIAAAVLVGGTVYYPPGTYKRTGAPPTIPVNLTLPIKILGAGRGDTIFDLKEAARRTFDFATSAPGDTLGNCELTDFTVNGNSLTSASGDHVVIGTLKAGSTAQRVNIRHAKVRRIETLNIPIQEGAVSGRRNVMFAVSHPENGATKNEVTDILVEDCVFEGGNYGVGIVGQSGAGHSANVFIDDVAVRRIRHVRPAPLASASSAHVQIGSSGWGRRAVVEDVYGTGSGDVGIEIDNLTAVSVSRCLIEEAWNECYLATNFVAAGDAEPVTSNLAAEVKSGAGPVTVKLADAVAEKLAIGDSFLFADSSTTAETVSVESVVNATELTVSTVANNHASALAVQRVGRLAKQRHFFTDCRARRVLGTQGAGFVVQNTNNVVPIGEVVLRDCAWNRRTIDFGSESGEALACQVGITGAPRALRVGGFTAVAEGVAYVGAATKIPKMIFLVGNQNVQEMELDLTDVDLSYEGVYVSGGGGLEVQLLYMASVKAALSARNWRVAANLATSNKKLGRLVYLQATNVGALHGRVDGITVRSSTNDEKIRAIQTGNAPAFSERLLLSGLDTRGLPEGSTDVFFGTEAGQLVSVLPGNAWRGAPKGAAFTLGASGEAKRLETGYCGTMTLIGGTLVTKIEVSNDGTNYQAVLTQAGAALPAISVPMMGGSYIKVTYTTVPTAIFMPAP